MVVIVMDCACSRIFFDILALKSVLTCPYDQVLPRDLAPFHVDAANEQDSSRRLSNSSGTVTGLKVAFEGFMVSDALQTRTIRSKTDIVLFLPSGCVAFLRICLCVDRFRKQLCIQ